MILDVATVVHGTRARVVRLERTGEMSTDGLSVADLQRPVGGVTIDSRSVLPGELFVAVPGERVDGQDYIGHALQSGAVGCLVSRVPDVDTARSMAGAGFSEPRYLFVVPDVLIGLQRLAAYWRNQHAAEVVGITGSIGKTTSKEIVASVLASKWPVLKSEANLNTEIGLPLMLLRLTGEHRAAVLEMGMYQAGDIAVLAKIARPRIGLVTNVAPIHLERLGAIERIARAKSELVAALPPDGLSVLNGDDPWTRAMAMISGVAPARLVGAGPDCEYRADEITSLGLNGVTFTLIAEGRRIPIQTRIPGVHTVNAVLMAAAVARFLDLTWDEIQAAIGGARVDVRQRVVPGPDGALIIDDSYNAAPMSVNAALEILKASPGPHIAALGDMLELGALEETAHRQIGERVAEVADWLVLRGTRTGWIAEEAERRGLPNNRIVRAATNADAADAIREIVSHVPADDGSLRHTQPEHDGARCTVLVKGSRGMKMEEVVQALESEG